MKPVPFRLRMLILTATLCVTFASSAIPAHAFAINNVWFRWSNNYNGSMIIGYDMNCRAWHGLIGNEVAPSPHYLGSWTWGPLVGREERYGATGINPDLATAGVSELDFVVNCSDEYGEYARYTYRSYRVRTVPSSTGPRITWWQTGGWS